MELFVAASLIGGTFLLNKNKENVKEEFIKESNNIYDYNFYNEARRTEQAAVHSNFINKTGNIIPRFMNQLYSENNMIENKNYDKSLLNSVYLTFDNEAKELFNSSNNMKNSYDMNDLNNDNNIALVSQLGGSLIDELTVPEHNNMVPFYGGRIKQSLEEHNRESDGKLELYSGQKKLNRENKTETAAFFEPTPENIYGSHEQRDLSRYVPSNLGKSNNELPFEQIKVGPGLNKGYTSAGSDGFHPMVRILPPTKEDLRVDPVLETEGRIISGKNHITKSALLPNQSKNRQSLFVENKNGERNFTTTGAIKGRKLRSIIKLKTQAREVSEMLIGHAHNSGASTSINNKNTYKTSTKQNFTNQPFRNLSRVNQLVTDYGKASIENRETERALTGQLNYLGIATDGAKGQKINSSDLPKQTKKQAHTLNKHSILNVSGLSKHITYDPNDKMRTTTKEQNIDHNHVGFFNSFKKSINSLTDKTKTTKREQTEDLNHLGNFTSINLKKGKNMLTDKAKKTRKETTIENNNMGTLTGNKKNKINHQDAMKSTHRETYENNPNDKGYVNVPVKKSINKTIDEQRTTRKETTLIEDHLQGANIGNENGYLVSNKDDVKQPQRSSYSDVEHIGGANSAIPAERRREAEQNARLNELKEVVQIGRAPVQTKEKLFNSNIHIQTKKLETDRENKYARMKTGGENFGYINKDINSQTSFKNRLPIANKRLDPVILNSLNNNPLNIDITTNNK